MTATDEKTPESGDTVASTGRVARVIGPVVDVEFPADQMPEIYFALHVDVTPDADTRRTLTLEVEQHIGDNIVRAISIFSIGPASRIFPVLRCPSIFSIRPGWIIIVS